MKPAILALEAEAPLAPERVDAFLSSHRIPIVEGPSCTFLWRGEAESVSLRHGIFGLPSSQPFVRIAASDLWYHIVDLPERSRVEYKIEVVRNGKRMYVASDGKTYEMSLQNECIRCHSNKTQFCDQCHNYAGLKADSTPYCWTCHIPPKETK